MKLTSSFNHNHIAFFSTMVIFLTVTAMAVLSSFTQNEVPFFTSTFYLFLSLLNYLFYLKLRNFNLWSDSLLILTALGFIVLFWHGGTQGSVQLWSFALPLIVFLLKDHNKGLFYALTYELILLVIFVLSLVGIAPSHQTWEYMAVFFVILTTESILLKFFGKKQKLTEIQIMNESQKFMTLFNSLSTGAVMVSPDRKILEANKIFKEWFPEYQTCEQQYCFECLTKPADFVDYEESLTGRTFKDGVSRKKSIRKQITQGSRIFLVTTNPLKNQSNQVYAVIETIEDITGIRRIDQLLEESESRFRTLFEQLPEIAVQGYDKDNRVTFWNKASEELTGIKATDAIGKLLDELTFLPLDSRNYHVTAMKEWIQGGKSIAPREEVMIQASGKPIYVTRIYVKILNRKGEAEIYCFNMNQTDRHMAEVALHDNDMIFQNAADMLCIVGFDGYLKTINPSWVQTLGWSSEELLSNPIIHFIHPEDRDAAQKVSEKIWENKDGIYYENRCLCKDGSIKWLSWRAIPSVEQKIVYGAVRDITERKRMEMVLKDKTEELEKINVTKDTLFSIIAHDLRSPFNSFIGFTDLMTEQDSDMTLEEYRNFSKKLNQLAKSSLDVLENLLEWCRIQRGLVQPNPSEVNLAEFIYRAVETCNDKIWEKEQLIHYKIDSDLNVCMDANVVDAVIRNLLTNAVKFTPKGGIITIEAGFNHNKNLQIAVSDTGIGIPSEIIPELFTFNVKKGRPGTNREKSSGLGLMICKEFVELLGGTIWVESTEFKGSTFYIEIPLA